jgi:hypothetical protein
MTVRPRNSISAAWWNSVSKYPVVGHLLEHVQIERLRHHVHRPDDRRRDHASARDTV